jgi:hypothetical protein
MSLRDVLGKPLHDQRLVDKVVGREGVLEEVTPVAILQPGLAFMLLGVFSHGIA